MQRAIPPDPAAASPRPPGISQQEAIGDLHLAADAYANALEAYRSALRETKADALEQRVRLMLRISEAERLRGRFHEALAEAVEEITALGQGDILVFLPTERDILEAHQKLRGWEKG